ncbi:Structure-specific endonuclease subunit SLX1 [Spathaspora sp. JA1]|nr:Structure-specific endonuclease subunit SLX1 [Spathaspora sp. JA1]
MLHTTPQFYCVYLLQSIPKPRTFYIGSTPDITRRLRQHNGDLKAGGAFRTKRAGCRPWKVCLIVYNFPSRISALQFEHSLQHPQFTRRISADERISKSQGVSVHQRLANVKLLVGSAGFGRLGLRVRIFEQEVLDAWEADRYGLGSGKVEFGGFDEFKMDDVNDFDKFKEKVLNEEIVCSVCHTSIDVFKDVPLLTTREELSEFLGEFPLIVDSYEYRSSWL